MDDLELHGRRGKLAQGVHDAPAEPGRLLQTYSALDGPFLDLAVQVLEGHLLHRRHSAFRCLAVRNSAGRGPFVPHRANETLAGAGNARETDHFDGNSGPANSTRSPCRYSAARTRPNMVPDTKMSPWRSVPDCTSTVATGPALSSFCLDDGAAGHLVGIRLELKDVRLDKDHLQQVLEADLFLCRYFAENGLSPHSSGASSRSEAPV